MSKANTALFGLGCFWLPDVSFSKLPGVIKTTVGYSGGDIEKPSYEIVCGGGTGHTEVVQIEYDPDKTSYEKLLEHFFMLHNPLHPHKPQYRSVIFYKDEKQKAAAEKIVSQKQKELGSKLSTTVEPAKKFYPAEDYHQKYLEKQKDFV